MVQRILHTVHGVGSGGNGILCLAAFVQLDLAPLGVDQGTEEAEDKQTHHHNKTHDTQLGAEEAAHHHLRGGHKPDVLIQRRFGIYRLVVILILFHKAASFTPI